MQYGPAENSQVANYREALEKFPVSVIRNKWSKEEREKLSNGVKQQFQKMLLQRSVDLPRYLFYYVQDANSHQYIYLNFLHLPIILCLTFS